MYSIIGHSVIPTHGVTTYLQAFSPQIHLGIEAGRKLGSFGKLEVVL